MVNIAAEHGRFDVEDLLYGRKTISEFSKLKAEELKQKLKIELTEPQEADSIAVTLDLWTDEFKHMSYLDAHAFWIDTNFELKHRMLAVRHFGIERHTSENIANAVKAIFSEYNIDPSKVTATTDHGANMVAAFNALHDTGRLDCMAHRLHTCFSSMWSRACSVKPEVLQYDTAAAALAKYCNQAAGVQEQLPVSVKKGSTTRRWEELIDRAHSIKESYEDLVRILSEPHRDRAMLIASVNRKLNAEILDFMEPFRKLFETLQHNTKPTINFAVLTYYKATALSQRSTNDSPVISTLKDEFRSLMDEKYYGSLRAHHWLATFLDPDFKRFQFLPCQNIEDNNFKRQLLRDIDDWALEHMERARVASSPADVCRTKSQRLDRNDDPFSDFRELDGAQPQTGNGQNDARKEELRQVSVTLPYLRYIKLYETKSILIDCFL